ncbi:hypothetical protein [Ferruginibacter albus]|uniref:hypothetical protein n=1 Tax=Ferruginibacter albus TaxID=2875540 RepID=UPI001CC40711|nr:hypothetical protein [Ferruginibacter albus]UAY50611.1 hypothetical protein K9M53_08380 [Ferruginibacter albus]
MKKIILFSLLLLPFFTMAQKVPESKRTSLIIYERQLSALRIHAYDSLVGTEQYKKLVKKIDSLRSKGHGYIAFSLFGDMLHSDYSNLNNSITQSGFTKLNPFSSRFGIGISSQKKRRMFDFYFAVIGLNNNATKENESIKVSLSSLLEFDWGYDFIKSLKVNLYPYLGFSLRNSSLEYSKPSDFNPNYTNISNIVLNNRSVFATSTTLAYQAGVALDVLIDQDKNKRNNTFLFAKFGTTRAFNYDEYDIGGNLYKPKILQGDWLITLGFKFASWD